MSLVLMFCRGQIFPWFGLLHRNTETNSMIGSCAQVSGLVWGASLFILLKIIRVLNLRFENYFMEVSYFLMVFLFNDIQGKTGDTELKQNFR